MDEDLSERLPTEKEKQTIRAATTTTADDEIIPVPAPGQQHVATTTHPQQQQGGHQQTTTSVTVTLNHGGGFNGLLRLLNRIFQSPDTPEGYNATRRFTARWILWGVCFGLFRTRLFLAVGCAAASIVILKEGTVWSGKNLKWMLLSLVSFASSVLAWSFRRVGWNMLSHWLASMWAAILGLFLVSALLGSKKDQDALKAALVKGTEHSKVAADVVAEHSKIAATKGKHVAGKAAGIASKKLEEFSKKME